MSDNPRSAVVLWDPSAGVLHSSLGYCSLQEVLCLGCPTGSLWLGSEACVGGDLSDTSVGVCNVVTVILDCLKSANFGIKTTTLSLLEPAKYCATYTV